MITPTNVLVLAAMIVGTVGIVVPVLPGLFIVWAAVLVWSSELQTSASWVVLAVATGVYAAGLVGKYLFPGRRMRAAGVPTWIVGVALAVAVVGLFVIPVVGAPLGFVGAIYLLERFQHEGRAQAWAATRQALRAVAMTIGIELVTALAVIATWAFGVWATRP